jgi:hypothetical protein
MDTFQTAPPAPPAHPAPPPIPAFSSPSPEKKQLFKRKPFMIVAGAALFLVVVSIVGTVTGILTPEEAATQDQGNTYVPPASYENTAPSVPEPEYYQPLATDFALSVKVLEKTCYGSAGCNLSYRVKVGYGGEPLDPSKTYELTYEVRGGEDGPQVNTLTVQGDSSQVDEEELISTKSSKAKLSVVVLSIEEVQPA